MTGVSPVFRVTLVTYFHLIGSVSVTVSYFLRCCVEFGWCAETLMTPNLVLFYFPLSCQGKIKFNFSLSLEKKTFPVPDFQFNFAKNFTFPCQT